MDDGTNWCNIRANVNFYAHLRELDLGDCIGACEESHVWVVKDEFIIAKMAVQLNKILSYIHALRV